MPTIVFIHPDGRLERIHAEVGESVMLAALSSGVNGIVAECSGGAVCGTCHVYVDEGWIGRLTEMDSCEDDALEGTAADRLSNSRLSCQIRLTRELDGLVLRLPERQT
jgi:2Fe-2S ferredoxin